MDNITASKEFVGIRQLIEEKSGIVLNDQNAHLLENRLASILNTFMLNNLEELYFKLCVEKDPEITHHVIEAITTNETFWFRDKALWVMMEDLLLPHYVDTLRNNESKKIRIWSAACSYGQEPYSIAMCIAGYLQNHAIEDVDISSFEILATDISNSALNTAKSAQYDTISISRGLEDSYKQLHFKREGNGWKLNDAIRKEISFQHFNLIDGSYTRDMFDLILCRNVLIYFSESNKKQIYRKMAQALKSDGVLLIGSSELLDDDNQHFSREQYLNGIYYKKKSDEEGDVL